MPSMVGSTSTWKGEKLCSAASLLLPLLLYIWTAAPASIWLDSGEFLAAGFVLGGAHPPGHPLFINFVKIFMMIPIGSLAFRGSLASAIPAAVACCLTFHINLQLSKRLDEGAPRWMAPFFALLGALFFAVTPALWGEATRTEVYALQIMVVLFGVLALVHFGLEKRGERSARFVALAGLAFGLSLANHHFLSLLLLPGVIVLFTEDALARWKRTLKLVFFGACPAILTGLLVYLHLPLRARNAPGAVSLGIAPDLSTFLWVISARAYQKSVTEVSTTTFGDRLVDAAFFIAAQVGPLTIVLALGGFYILIRLRWGVGLFLFLSLVATWLARSWIGFDPQNPDVLGYFLVTICFIALSLSRLGPSLASVIPAKLTTRVGVAMVTALGMVGTSTYLFATNWETCDRSNDRGAEIIAEEQLYHLPPRSVLVTELFGSAFNIWSAQIIEGMRPDVAHFHFPFIGYPSYVQQVHAVHNDLQGVLREALARGELDSREISALAQRRPVFVEPMLETPARLQPFLLPHGLLWEAAAEPLGSTDLRLAALDHAARWDEVLARLGAHQRDEQTRRVLLWRLYIDALLLAQQGERDGAAEAVYRGLIVAPNTPELMLLGQALDEGQGRLDITPFLPAGARHQQEEEEARPRRIPVLDF